MTQSNELHDLQQRIARLPLADQLWLFERVLGEIRNRHFTDHQAIKQEIAAREAWLSAQPKTAGLAEDAKREAG